MAAKLYVGGLSYSTTSETLREYFAQCGTVESASVVTDKFSGQSRGFGFVEMATSEEAQRAIAELNGKELDGRKLTVNVSNPRPAGGAGAARAVAAAVGAAGRAGVAAGPAAAVEIEALTAFRRPRSRSAGSSASRVISKGAVGFPPRPSSVGAPCPLSPGRARTDRSRGPRP